MAFCEGCGQQLVLGDAICSKCGKDVSDAMDIGDGQRGNVIVASPQAPPTVIPQTPPTAAPQTPPMVQVTRPTIPGTNVVLALNETIWRVYNVTQLRSVKQGQGQLVVTSSRLIFHALAQARRSGSVLVMETHISTITGMRTYVSNRVMRWLLVVGSLFALLGLLALAKRSGAGVLFVLIGAGLIALGFSRFGRRGTVTVEVAGQASSDTPVSFGNAWQEQTGFFHRMVRAISGPFGFFTNLFGMYDAFDFTIGIPGPDAMAVAAELGAIVHDIQSKGSLAETHWGVSAA